MRGIGYWRNEHEEEFRECPLPQNLVDRSWQAGELTRVIAYLASGRVYEVYRGYSHCRFRCGIESRLMGSCDLTDGSWVWPQGLAHYVETHAVALPDEFVTHCAENDWVVPAWKRSPTALDLAYWVSWSKARPQHNA
jgi:hypothetical protein